MLMITRDDCFINKILKNHKTYSEFEVQKNYLSLTKVD